MHLYPDKYFYVFPGNGHNLIKQALFRKPGWREIKSEMVFSGKCNFVWKPTNFNYKMQCQID